MLTAHELADVRACAEWVGWHVDGDGMWPRDQGRVMPMHPSNPATLCILAEACRAQLCVMDGNGADSFAEEALLSWWNIHGQCMCVFSPPLARLRALSEHLPS